MKRQVPAIITTVTGTIVFLSIILFKTDAAGWPGQFDRMRQFMAAVMMFMGMANMMRVHGSAIRKKDRTGCSPRGSLVIMFAYAISEWPSGTRTRPTDGFTTHYSSDQLDNVRYGSLLFTSASYKAFRAKTLDAALMMACAVWVMLSNVPVGDVCCGVRSRGWAAWPELETGSYRCPIRQYPEESPWAASWVVSRLSLGFSWH